MWFFFKTWNLSHVAFTIDFSIIFFWKIEPFEAKLFRSNNRLQSLCKYCFFGQRKVTFSLRMHLLKLVSFTLLISTSGCIGYTNIKNYNDNRSNNLVSLIPKESCSVGQKKLKCVCKNTDTDVHFNFEVRKAFSFTKLSFLWLNWELEERFKPWVKKQFYAPDCCVLQK